MASFAVFCLCPAPAAAQSGLGEDFHVELGAMFWSPTPEATISTGGLARVGIDGVDFVDDFGIENRRFTEFRITAKPGRKHKIRFSYVPVKYEEQATLTRTIQFGGLTVPVTAQASADLQWDLWRFGYEWDFIARDRGFVGLLGELKYNKVSAELSAVGIGTEFSEVQAPIPTVGVVARGYLHPAFSITGELSGFKVPESWSEEFQGKFVDFDLYGTLNIGRYVGVQGGYRSVVADYADDNDSGALRLKGLYLGGVVRF